MSGRISGDVSRGTTTTASPTSRLATASRASRAAGVRPFHQSATGCRFMG